MMVAHIHILLKEEMVEAAEAEVVGTMETIVEEEMIQMATMAPTKI
jgi:hypothetical protein